MFLEIVLFAQIEYVSDLVKWFGGLSRWFRVAAACTTPSVVATAGVVAELDPVGAVESLAGLAFGGGGENPGWDGVTRFGARSELPVAWPCVGSRRGA